MPLQIATPDYNFYIITGPNMGGKTIYIKMIAMLQIMAQLGCYVPATNAQFRITDRVFCRMGFNDSLEQGSSSFTQEASTRARDIHYYDIYYICNVFFFSCLHSADTRIGIHHEECYNKQYRVN